MKFKEYLQEAKTKYVIAFDRGKISKGYWQADDEGWTSLPKYAKVFSDKKIATKYLDKLPPTNSPLPAKVIPFK